MTVFVDSNVPMYVAGRSHQFKAPCIEFMRAVARRRIQAVSDVEVLQEILYRYYAVRQRAVGVAVFEAFIATVPLVYPVLLEDLLEGKSVLDRHAGIQPRDAIHVAVMRRAAIRTVVSYDRHFDVVPDVRRVTPNELV